MQIHIEYVRGIKTPIYKQLYSLNFRADGLMRGALVLARRSKNPKAEEYNYQAVYMLDGDTVVAWCMFMPSAYDKYTRKLAHVGENPHVKTTRLDTKVVELYFWTRKQYRGNGYAKKIGTFAAHTASKMGLGVCKVHPWDHKSRKLMESLETASPLPVRE